MEGHNEEYSFRYLNNHPVIEIEGKVFIIDTGSPISFFADGQSGILRINNRHFNLANNPLDIDFEGIESLVGISINGIMGFDILESLENLYMSRVKNIAYFCKSDIKPLANTVKLKNRSIMGMHFLETQIELNGDMVNAIIDSGACVSYISSEHIEKLMPVGKVYDYSPSFGGEIRTEKYEIQMTLCSEKETVSFAKMTPLIECSVGMLGYDAILGLAEFKWNELILDISRGIMSYN